MYMPLEAFSEEEIESFAWNNGAIYLYKNWTIASEEQQGRKYFSIRNPSSFIANESSSVIEAKYFIDYFEEEYQ